MLPTFCQSIPFKKLSQIFFSFRLRHGIQAKGNIWEQRGGSPAVGAGAEEAERFIRLVLEKAGLPPLKILLKLLYERRRKSR
jgi:hypothetical protein